MIEMLNHIDRLDPLVNAKVFQYLTGQNLDKKERFLDEQTLRKFNIGYDDQTFFSQDIKEWVTVPCVFFPMYAPLSAK